MPRATRILLAALFALALSAAAGCGGGASSDQSKPAQDLLRTAADRPARSADLSVVARATLRGGLVPSGPFRLSVSGPYRSGGAGALPSLDWKLTGEGVGQRLGLRLVIAGGDAYIGYEGRTYALGRRLGGRAGRGTSKERGLRRLGLDPASWLKDGKVGAGPRVDGVPTREASGQLDVGRVLHDVNKLIQSPAVRAGLPPGTPVPTISDRAIGQIEDAVKDPRVTVDVGRRDNIVRRASVQLGFNVPEDQQSRAGGVEGGTLSVVVRQAHVNGDQRVVAPSGARPLSELLRRLRITPHPLGVGLEPL
ncbi:MAG TPA: hypothetical protein VE780_16390 [Thermoleophilaceae bacterium]|nr:hypothetical protein [Thermoleophilaceae bacterium]